MFIEDLKNDFYNLLLGNRVLMLVHYDVDAVCACKILQGLFKSDNISYTLVPVGGIAELKKAYEENNEEIKYVVLVNCGGTIDLVDILQPEEDVVFFVLDSHKPTDVCNVYSDGQVRLVYKDSEENIPNFDDIFRDDEEDEEEPESGREGVEALVERRRERRAWEERRNTLMFNYTQFSYYGKPSAVICCTLARLVSRVSCVTSWCGCVSVAAAEELGHRTQAAALLDSADLNPLASSGEWSICVCVCVRLPLFRRWSVWAALRHAPALAPRLRLHARAGDQRLRALLADMGIPLQQAQQSFGSMDVELRHSLATACEAACARAGAPRPTHAGAELRRHHAPPVPALDVVYEIMGLLYHETLSRSEGFQAALSALSLSGTTELGITAAKRGLMAVAATAGGALAARRVSVAGPFLLVSVESVRGPLWAGVTARWIAAAAPRRAVLLAAPSGGSDTMLVGVPPHHEQESRNLFGAAFEQAAAKSGVSVSLDFMDSSVITLPTAQRTQFLDALTALLA